MANKQVITFDKLDVDAMRALAVAAEYVMNVDRRDSGRIKAAVVL